MPSNERENQRIEKKKQKDKKTRFIVWIILFVIIIALIIMKVCEIDFYDLKNKINSTNETSISASLYPVRLDGMNDADVKLVNDKLDILTNSQFVSLEPSSGKKLYSFDHGYSNPILETAGNYTCIYDQGGTRIRLDTNSDLLFEKSLDKNIISATVSQNGSIIFSTFSDNGKSKLVVINKNGNKKLDYDVSDGYITSIAANSSASRIAYVTVNSKDAYLISTIHILSVSDCREVNSFSIKGDSILRLKYTDSDNIYVVGDSFLSVIKSDKKMVDVFSQGNISTLNYCFTVDGELIINYSKFQNAASSKIAYVKSNGKIKTEISLKSIPKYISSNSNEISVLLPNKIVTYSLRKGEKKNTIKCDNSLNSAYTLSSKNYVQYGQCIDRIE